MKENRWIAFAECLFFVKYCEEHFTGITLFQHHNRSVRMLVHTHRKGALELCSKIHNCPNENPSPYLFCYDAIIIFMSNLHLNPPTPNCSVSFWQSLPVESKHLPIQTPNHPKSTVLICLYESRISRTQEVLCSGTPWICPHWS